MIGYNKQNYSTVRFCSFSHCLQPALEVERILHLSFLRVTGAKWEVERKYLTDLNVIVLKVCIEKQWDYCEPLFVCVDW